MFEGVFPIAGWDDRGGGLLSPPVWFSDYARADGARLVLVEWEMPRRPDAQHATFQITDVLEVAPPPQGYALAFFCEGPQPDITRSILAVVRADPMLEYWHDVHAAWAVDHFSGQVTPIAPAGIACVNESWGV